MSCQKGLSSLEIIVAAAILGLVVAVTLPQFSKSRERQVLSGAVGDALAALNTARADTLGSLESSSYGVRFEPSRITIFKGTSFTAGAAENTEIGISSPAAISNVTLGGASGSTGSIYFNRLSGNPSTSGTVTISTPSYSKVISISATGALSAQ
jgi:type II secretory pathway pseudopilin PulG